MQKTKDEPLWKALADPTRRMILDLLRNEAKTTTELSEAFDMTRFGVMKHLNVLEDAGLVLVRREGRNRFNHLNQVPLEELYQRWVQSHAQPTAKKLLNLKHYIEEKEKTMSNTILSFHIEQEIQLNASNEKVWAALTKDIGQWWAFHIGPVNSTITLDNHVGGQFIERWGDGEGELFATISYLKKGRKITLEGSMGKSGPGYSKFSFTLSSKENQTTLALNHHCYGHRDPETESNYQHGWTELFGHLKNWVEKNQPVQPKHVGME